MSSTRISDLAVGSVFRPLGDEESYIIIKRHLIRVDVVNMDTGRRFTLIHPDESDIEVVLLDVLTRELVEALYE